MSWIGQTDDDTVIRIFDDIPHAQATILRRVGWDEQELPAALLDGIERRFGERLTPELAVARVLRDVRLRGDLALREWSQRIEDVTLDALQVSQEEIDAAVASLAVEMRDALALAVQRLEAFHRKQPIGSWMDVTPGGTLGQIVRPLQRVGIYVPAGSAPLPSSLLHAAIPARVAGVAEIVVCTPPDRTTGRVAPLTLAAAHAAGVHAIYCLGGAQAIAAMAFGTETIPRVDKIVGPGGLFVTLAKRQVFGQVGIDGLPGPTETVIIADDSADPALAAADLLAQAEHDVLASAILLTPSRRLAELVQVEVAHQLEALSRAEIAAASLAGRGGIVVTGSLAQAVSLANDYAPEHRCLPVTDPWSLVGQIRNAGGIFVGEHSFEVLGDYVAGPSHVMPTEGTARFASPLSVADFVKRISLIALEPGEGRRLSGPAAILAEGEGLTAHAAAARALGDEGHIRSHRMQVCRVQCRPRRVLRTSCTAPSGEALAAESEGEQGLQNVRIPEASPSDPAIPHILLCPFRPDASRRSRGRAGSAECKDFRGLPILLFRKSCSPPPEIPNEHNHRTRHHPPLPPRIGNHAAVRADPSLRGGQSPARPAAGADRQARRQRESLRTLAARHRGDGGISMAPYLPRSAEHRVATGAGRKPGCAGRPHPRRTGRGRADRPGGPSLPCAR